MARQVAIPHTHTSDVTSFDSTNSTYYAELSGYPADNGLGDGSSAYAGFNMTRGANAITEIYYNFDCSAIPDNATITSVTCSERASISTTTTKYIKLANLQLCAGTTAKGSSVSIKSTTAQYYSVNGGNSWTVAEVKNCKIRGYAQRGTRNTSSQYEIRMFGGTLTVNYTVNGMAYTITATSSVTGETVSPASQEVYEGTQASININTTSISNRLFTDNNINAISSLTYIPPNTGGTETQYPDSYAVDGTVSGTNYMQLAGHGVDNPMTYSGYDKTNTASTTATVYHKFNFNNIPASATISSMTIQVRYKNQNFSQNDYPESAQVCKGTSKVGSAISLTSTTETTATISSYGSWTAAELRSDPRVAITVSFDGIIITGITWSVTYTANEPAYYSYTISNVTADHTLVYSEAPTNMLYVKQNGTWVTVSKLYVKQNGTWTEQALTYISDNNISSLVPNS